VSRPAAQRRTDDVRSKYDNVSRDVGGKQPSEPKKADYIHASRSQAENARQQLHAEWRIYRARRWSHRRMGSPTVR
jgi:hypothetical protein